ncbi:NTP transferase domain-containing protein [Treponema sp. Marseille-Q3903]|uniref:NTP transferase domain-containing protein n=1 Tax=Treponema sp. Marseille-Q3903 TaxID=2766703 RepID=UPI00351C4061
MFLFVVKLRFSKNHTIFRGYGLRMIPVNMENPKALLTVDGVPLIERQISQLHEAGIEEIFIITGFQKEKFEYLIDKYNVKLVYNKDYASKNNLHSLNCVREKIGNSYIIPCDLWCSKNPYSSIELYSWYMLNELIDENSIVRVNRQLEINIIKKKQNGNSMVGISFIA